MVRRIADQKTTLITRFIRSNKKRLAIVGDAGVCFHFILYNSSFSFYTSRPSVRMDRLGASFIGFAEVAIRTKCLEILKHGLASVAPRHNVIHLQFDAYRDRGAAPATATSETVTLQNLP